MILRLACVLLATALLALSVRASAAHDAPSGMVYPPACCGGHDCRPVACEEIQESKSGWTWRDIPFKDVLPSRDRACHACTADYTDASGGPKQYGRCLFVIQGY